MIRSPILVIGATGRVGREVVSQLVAEGARVRALSRDPESAVLTSEIEIFRGDLTIPDTLDAALDGVGSVFLVWTAPGGAFPAALDRIAKHAKRLVFLTSPHQTPHPFFQQPNPLAVMHAEMEQMIERSDLAWTFLRPGMFAANSLSWWAAQIRAGDVVRWPYADAPTAPIHEGDIAAVAVRTLLEIGHEGANYVLTGPQSLSQSEQVSVIGDVIGRKLRIEEISPDEARIELGFPAPVINMLLNAWAAAVDKPAFVTNIVKEVTGKSARTFSDWVSDHATEFRS
jgi:uncharacterized protein YbjT (DUF2867 family)